MKFRTSFVTNSSSSSFVCEICGRTESGWDLCLSECEMMECVNGHIFCCDEVIEMPTKENMVKTILENEWNKECWINGETKDYTEEELINMDQDFLFENFYSEDGYYEVPECMCPICQFVEYSQSDLSAYLLKEYGVQREEVFAEVKKLNKRRKKLYDEEYITYVCKKYDFLPTAIVAGWKEKFGTYNEFSKWLRQ
jgi:hypothetical protein